MEAERTYSKFLRLGNTGEQASLRRRFEILMLTRPNIQIEIISRPVLPLNASQIAVCRSRSPQSCQLSWAGLVRMPGREHSRLVLPTIFRPLTTGPATCSRSTTADGAQTTIHCIDSPHSEEPIASMHSSLVRS